MLNLNLNHAKNQAQNQCRWAMKLLVFAHTPPPHHGQSYMVQLMLAGLGGDRRRKASMPAAELLPELPASRDHGIQCYHVNARLSRHLEDIGDLRIGKFFLLLWYILQAIWCRFRYGVRTFYYIPAPGKRSALYRDWVVMALCRPFFKRVILHWHAAGLAKWLETSVQIRARAFTYHFLKQVDLSIVLSKYNRADAEKLFSRQIRVVGNGIPDPCPDYDKNVLPRQRLRRQNREKLLQGQLKDPDPEANIVRVAFLAHCTREKGVFDTARGVILANELLRQQRSPLQLELVLAGNFVNPGEREEFDELVARTQAGSYIECAGFVSGDQKRELLRRADVFCFPTYYRNENQPVNLIEAMAFGLPILTTRWRSIPELFPADYPGLVDVKSPEQVARGLLALIHTPVGEGFRETFQRQFTIEGHLAGLAEAFHSVEKAATPALPAAQAAAPSPG
jgi:glycosyltransferase involved in cell wall biosynthesis